MQYEKGYKKKKKMISCQIRKIRVIQSTLVIYKSKRLSEMLQDIPTSTYKFCKIEEKINRTTTFHK